jgi:hypothetical protein
MEIAIMKPAQARPSSSFPLSAALILFVLLVVLTGGLSAARSEAQQGKTTPTPVASRPGAPGFDFFRTNAKTTSFQFREGSAIPAGFFAEGSSAFMGSVAFKGVPLGSFRDHKTGNADTIVERKSMPDLHSPFPSSGKTDVELVALSLQSTRPIKVQVGRKTQLWDVRVQLSPSRASTGTMQITQRNSRGGDASSELTVYPLLIFTRRGGNEEKRLDLGDPNSADKGMAGLTLRATGMPWVRTAPAGALVVQGLSGNFFITQGTEKAKLAWHGIFISD